MTDKGYMLHITNTHNRWVLGKIRELVSLNYSILGKLIDLASYTVFGQLNTVSWLAQASTLTDTQGNRRGTGLYTALFVGEGIGTRFQDI